MMTQLEGHAITGNQAGWDFYISTGGLSGGSAMSIGRL